MAAMVTAVGWSIALLQTPPARLGSSVVASAGFGLHVIACSSRFTLQLVCTILQAGLCCPAVSPSLGTSLGPSSSSHPWPAQPESSHRTLRWAQRVAKPLQNSSPCRCPRCDICSLSTN